MPSPFPGMDLGSNSTGDVHTRLVTRYSGELQDVLRRDQRASVEDWLSMEWAGVAEAKWTA